MRIATHRDGVWVMIALAMMIFASASPHFAEASSESDPYLAWAESGRETLINGRVDESRTEFKRLVDYLLEYEEGPVIRLRGVHDALLAGILTDDRGRTYQLSGYEAIMAFQHQALNHLFSGDTAAAWVEWRRAFYAQYFLARDYRDKLEDLMAALDPEEYEKSLEQFRTSSPAMAQVLKGSPSSFSNPYVWFMSGIMFEAVGDLNSAFQSYREALTVHPDNPYLQRDVRRLARRLGQPLPVDINWIEQTDAAARDTGTELIVILEENVVSPRRSAKSFVFVGSFQPLVIPVYDDPPYRPVSVEIAVNDKPAGDLALLSSIQALAYHDLSEKMPGVIGRNTTRTTSRAVTYTAIRLAAPAPLRVLGSAYHAATAVSDQADTRVWGNLPMAVQMARLPVEPGRHTVRLTNRDTGRDMTVKVDCRAGQRTLLWVAATPERAVAMTASLSRPGNVTPYKTERSIVGLPRFEAPLAPVDEKKKKPAQELKVDRVDQFMPGRPLE